MNDINLKFLLGLWEQKTEWDSREQALKKNPYKAQPSEF